MSSACSPSPPYYPIQGGSGCFFMGYDAYSYTDTVAFCAKSGGEPISIETQAEWQGFYDYFTNYVGYIQMINSRCGGGFWTSLERTNINDCSSGYGWRKGFSGNSTTYLKPATYTNFAAGKPVCTAGVKSCFYMSANLGYQWTDSDCSATKCYICQQKQWWLLASS